MRLFVGMNVSDWSNGLHLPWLHLIIGDVIQEKDRMIVRFQNVIDRSHDRMLWQNINDNSILITILLTMNGFGFPRVVRFRRGETILRHPMLGHERSRPSH
jgi:hypothetical protein